LVGAGGQASFPLFVTDGALLDKDIKDLAPFLVVASWRKTRAMWLPQLPKFLFSSVRSLRRLHEANKGQSPPNIDE
jgi:hypothetical protein